MNFPYPPYAPPPYLELLQCLDLPPVPRRRRARRALAMVWWAPGVAAPSTLGLRVVHFWPIQPDGRTS